jgi:uncharacterized membrane protein
MPRGNKKSREHKRIRVISASDNEWEYIKPSFREIDFTPETGVIVSSQVLVTPHEENCYAMITSQLEAAQSWDPIILDVQPISRNRRQKGTTSRLKINLGGHTYETIAMICLCDDCRTLAWVSNDKVKVTEEWRLNVTLNSTVVDFTLQYSFPGKLGWFRSRLVPKNKVEQDVYKMLSRFKEIVEGSEPLGPRR